MRWRRVRWLSLLILISYLGAGPGSGAAAMAVDSLCGGRHAGVAACGCRGGHDCCGAPCCACALSAASVASSDPSLPDCCRHAPVAAGSDCCEAPPVTAEATAPGGRPDGLPATSAMAMTARCTCGDHEQHPPGLLTIDAHVPALAGTGFLPPDPSRLRPARSARAAGCAGEPREPVPKLLLFRSL